MSTRKRRTRARSRALRAAQAATMGLAMAAAGAVGCTASHGPPDPPPPGSDSGVADAGPGTDAGGSCDATFPETEACCAEQGGFWDEMYGCAIAVPGPFVPPAMV